VVVTDTIPLLLLPADCWPRKTSATSDWLLPVAADSTNDWSHQQQTFGPRSQSSLDGEGAADPKAAMRFVHRRCPAARGRDAEHEPP